MPQLTAQTELDYVHDNLYQYSENFMSKEEFDTVLSTEFTIKHYITTP